MNRLTQYRNVVNLTPRCQGCGGCHFEQKELRKTGISVKDGKVIYSSAAMTADVGFVCGDCGKMVPRADAARIVQLPGFTSQFRKDIKKQQQ